MSVLESDKKEQCGRLEGNAAITQEVAGKSHQKPLPDDAWIHSLIMKSGTGHIPVQKESPTQART